MLVIGLILLVVGYFLGIGLLETIGLILTVIGAVLMVASVSGHAVGGRNWF
jgi:hypothetical protein